MQATGGYLLPLQNGGSDLIARTPRNDHTENLECPLSPETMEAVNVVQNTPWAVNRWLFDVVSEVWSTGLAVADLPPAFEAAMPAFLPDETWATMDREAKHALKTRRAELHTENARNESRRAYLLDCLRACRELRDEPHIWYPHFLDFRGRMYPRSFRGPHPQSNDLGKALIHFAQGVRLGDRGFRWLLIRAANCAGQDKLPMAQRVEWALDHLSDIEAAAEEPLANHGWWADPEVDEPWGLLATCNEIARASVEPGGVEQFVSHLPIPLDGSCNGLQHLSAMGLDPIGAAATNLSDGPRNDVYQQVADIVARRVADDAATGVAEAVHWAGQVTRKTVKRAVMTTPYGVTMVGIRDQLIGDGLVPKHQEVGQATLANYMRDRITEALGEVIVGAKQIMAWMQECARVLGKVGLPMEWTTPAGTRVRQGYHRPLTQRIATLLGEVHVVTGHTPTIHAGKQVLAAAPNVIHSFDAAHLQLTVRALHAVGVRSFAMVHDSYGTHAGNTDLMAQALRETFVDIYRHDWLARLHADWQAQAGETNPLPAPPPRGDFDVAQVLRSEFFFA